MASLGELFVKVGADVQGFKLAMGDVNTQLGQLDKEMNKASYGFQAMGDRLASVGMGMTAAITLPIAGVGGAAIVAAGQLEQTFTAFKNFLGGADAAKKMLDDLKDFAASTPFEFADLTVSAKRLMAMGFEAEKVLPMLRTIGDAVAGIGGSAPEIDRVTLALGQMQAKGKVSAQEMNQLAELGIPAWKMLSDQIGISIPEAMKRAERGAIAASEAIPAILAGMNQKFGGLMQQQSQTLLGQWSNLKDQLGLTLMEIGTVLLPFAKSALEAFAPLLAAIKSLAEAFAKLPSPIQTAIVAVAGVAAAAGPLIFIAGQLMSAWATLGPMLAGVGTALGGVTAALTPVGLAVAAVAAAFAAWKLGEWAYEHIAPFKTLVDSAWAAIQAVASLVADVAILYFKGLWDVLSALGSLLGVVLVPILGSFWSALKTLAGWIGESLTFVFTGFSKILQAVADKLNALRTAIGEASGASEQAAIKSRNVNAAYSAMGAAANAAMDDTKGLAEATGKGTTSKPGFAAAAATAVDATKKWSKELDELQKKAMKKAKEEAVKFNVTLQATAKVAGEVYDQNEKLRNSLVNMKADLMAGRDATWAMNQALVDMKTDLRGVGDGVIDLAKASAPAWAVMSTNASDYKGSIGKLKDAYTELGLKSREELLAIATKTEDAKNAILGDQSSSDFAKKTAIYKALEAQRALAISLGTDLPEEQRKLMEKLKTETENGLGGDGLRKSWKDFSSEVSTIITNFAQDIGKSLFEGDLSWGEKLKGMLKSLGSAIVSLMIQPWVDAIAGFVTNTLDKLLKGSFEGIGGLLGDLGSKIKDIFTTSPSVPAPTVPGGGAPGGVGGTIGSGAWGAVGAVGAVAGAVSSIIGNFQMAGMNKSLDLIVAFTFQTANQLIYGIQPQINEYLPNLLHIHQRLIELREFGIKLEGETLDNIRDWAMARVEAALGVIDASIQQIAAPIEEWYAEGLPVFVINPEDFALPSGVLAASASRSLTTKVYIDGREVANAVVEYLEDQGVIAP